MDATTTGQGGRRLSTLESLLKPDPRVRVAIEGRPLADGSCVIYWMQRSQRGRDNPALNLAVGLGNALGVPVVAIFGLTADYPGAERRHYRFLVEGLADVERDLRSRGVAFVVRLGDPSEVVARFAHEVGAAIVIGDENPLRSGQIWRNRLAASIRVPLRFVDADVVIPTCHFPKEEYAARTIRPNIHKLLDEYLKPIVDLAARYARVIGGKHDRPWPERPIFGTVRFIELREHPAQV